MNNKTTLLSTLQNLKLSSIISHLDAKNNYSDNDYKILDELLKNEIEFRKTRSFNYRIKLSRFPAIKLLKDTEQKILLNNISINDIVDTQKNIMLIGGAGSGKTHLSLAIGYDLIENGYKVIYYKLHNLANILLKHKDKNTQLKFINKFKSFDMLIIDEFGYIPIDPKASYLLYELLLYGNSTILINTHLKFEEWGTLFGIEKTTKVIIDRITQNCQIIATGNKSFRHS